MPKHSQKFSKKVEAERSKDVQRIDAMKTSVERMKDEAIASGKDASKDRVIKDAEPIQNIISMLRKDLETTAKVTILTARLIAYPVRRYLKTLGLDVYVVAVGSSDPNDKAKWIENHIKKGYDDILFIDDSISFFSIVPLFLNLII